MRNLIAFMHMTLDGFVAGPKGELEWATVNEAVYQTIEKQMQDVDSTMYGRVTYQMMESYWPTVPDNPESSPQELEHAAWVNAIHKVVVSKTLEKVSWNNTQLINGNVTDEITNLKQQSGKTIMIFGSPVLTHALAKLGLIDGYLLYLNPTVLGEGVPLFEKGDKGSKLELIEAKPVDAGVVALRYNVKPVL